jgi:hypothetical protein
LTSSTPASFAGLVVVALLAAGCSGQPAANARTGSQAPDGMPAPGGVSSAQEGGVTTVRGTVVETVNASSYTYVRVDTGSGEVWAAASQFDVAVGDRVVVPLETPMENFHSPSLNRDFPVIYFTSAITREGDAAAPPSRGMPRLMSSRTPAADAAAPVREAAEPMEPVALPRGGTSIADVWANRKALAGKQVTVSGRVVKVTSGVLERNWLHVQDGTGVPGDGTNDLTVTTAAEARVGDVVVATGIVAVDEDFGSGYSYKVMVKDASLAAR